MSVTNSLVCTFLSVWLSLFALPETQVNRYERIMSTHSQEEKGLMVSSLTESIAPTREVAFSLFSTEVYPDYWYIPCHKNLDERMLL